MERFEWAIGLEQTLNWDTAVVALELGNSPQVLLTHYRNAVPRKQAVEFWGRCPAIG